MNNAHLTGVVSSIPKLHHTSFAGTDYYRSKIIITRTSGNTDELVIIFNQSQLTKIKVGEFISVEGEFNSYNEEGHLVLFVFCRKIEQCEEGMSNEVELSGTVCTKPIYRKTPNGKEIADVIISTNRESGSSDYLPCVFWGSLARRLTFYRVGDKIALKGRIQSRSYIKNGDKKIAYEISANELLGCEKESVQIILKA